MADTLVLSNRYELKEVIGHGGMSVVYKAYDRKRHRVVAVKVLRSELADNLEAITRFTEEANAVSRMRHDNIVNVYGFGLDGTNRYIVMEYVDSITLKSYIADKGPVSPAAAIYMTRQILAALSYVHKRNIVHRDVKSQNILIDIKGNFRLKLTDFGIAKQREKHSGLEEGPSSAAKEPASKVIGSVHYFSPEQAQGYEVDKRSDLYSTGIVLYEMLTGQLPFSGTTPEEVAQKHVDEDPPLPSQLRRQVSTALDEIVSLALQKDPKLRYSDAETMSADLRRALKHPKGGFAGKRLAPKNGKALVSSHMHLLSTKKVLVWTVASVAALALLLVGVFFARGLHRKSHTQMLIPDVTLWEIEQAKAFLDVSDIRYAIEENTEFDERIGLVIAQYPTPDTPVRKGTPITLYVCIGENASYIPTLTGLKLEEALKRLQECGLPVGQITYDQGDAVPGEVLSQDPEPGTYAESGVTVSLCVSGESAAVPDCLNMPLEDAQLLLDISGFSVGKIVETISDSAPNTVIAQSVPPQQQALLEAPIDLTVSVLSQERSFCADVEIHLAIIEPKTEVRMTLEDKDGLRTIYLAQLKAGEYIESLSLLSRSLGRQKLSVYVSGELAIQKEIEFR